MTSRFVVALYSSRHSPCHGEMTFVHTCTCLFPVYAGMRMLKGLTRWGSWPMVVRAIMDSFLIHHLMEMMDSFCLAPFATTSCTIGLSQAVIFASPDCAKHGSSPWMTHFCTLIMIWLYHNTRYIVPVSHSLQIEKLVFPLWTYGFLPYIGQDYLG